MKKLSYILIAFFFYSIGINCQVIPHYQINIEGDQSMNDIKFTRTFTWTKTSGDWWNMEFEISDVPKIVSFSNTIGISQSTDASISLTSGATYNVAEMEYHGNCQVYKKIIVNIPANLNKNVVELKIKYNIDISSDFNNPVVFQDPFPLTIDKNIFQSYLDESAYIPTKHDMIVEKGLELTKRHKNALSAVESIGQYMKAYIRDEEGLSDYGFEVFYRQSGDCDGQAHAMSGLLRSVNIPTRMSSGYFVDYKFTMNLGSPFGTITSGGNGNGNNQVYTNGHAWLEAYFPSTGWIRFDPAQNTMFFGWVNAIKHWEGNISRSFTSTVGGSMSGQGTPPTFTVNHKVEIKVDGNFNTDYSQVDFAQFDGVTNDNVLFAANHKQKNPPICIDCTPDENAPNPPILLNAQVKTVGSSKFVQLDWVDDPSVLYYVIYRCKTNETMTDNHYVTKTNMFEFTYDDILDDLEPGSYKYSVAAVNYYGESYNSNELTIDFSCYDRLISSKTYNKHSLEEGCYIEMEDVEIADNSYVFIKARERCVISSDFNIEHGCVLKIE